MSFFGGNPSITVWFLHQRYMPAIVDERIPLKRGKDGKWNWDERKTLTQQLREERRADEEKLKAAGLKLPPHHTTKAKAQAFAKLVKNKTGVTLEVVEGCYL